MIAKGNLHGDGGKLAAYLTTGKEGERAELAELRGFVAGNIRDAFLDVEIQSEATHCQKPFFHAYVRLPASETLTPEQWQTAADRIEKRLGFTDQPRAVAFHYKDDGETHMHVAWSRIDLDTMRAIDPGLYKNKLKELCREMERDFGLTIVRNERDPDQKTRAAGRDEFEQSRRLDTDLTAIRETIRDCWDRSDSGRAFSAALEQEGLILARGDRRDFVIVDAEGGDHALSKRITGATAAETRARMTDIDRAQLPGVDQAKETQLERHPDLDAHERGAAAELEKLAARETRQAAPSGSDGGYQPAGQPEITHQRPAERDTFLRSGLDHPEAAEMPHAEHGAENRHDIGGEIGRGVGAATGGLMVATNIIGKPVEKLSDFAASSFESLFAGRSPPRKISAAEYMDSPEARQDYLAQRQAERASDQAIERIRQHVESGKMLRPEDVRALTPEHLLNLKAKGDDYMREIIADRERDEARTWGRERER